MELSLEELEFVMTDMMLKRRNFGIKIGSERGCSDTKCKELETLEELDLTITTLGNTVELGHFDNKNTFSIEGKSISELSKRHNTVVIKRFIPVDDEQEEGMFFTELEMLTSVKHHNIVNLLGFCVEGFDMMLVTEKFSNENLSDYLGNVKEMRTLTWVKRLKICIDAARALNYLHFEMEDNKVMIHGNINANRIGFNQNWEAKIEDFQWAVFLPLDQKDEAEYRKTYFDQRYHVDPEYENTGELKRETNMYSFGVVLFEIVCGRRAGDQIYLNESKKGLVDVARQNFSTGTQEDMIDPAIKEAIGKMSSIPNRRTNKDSLQTFLKVANQCVVETQDQRPTIKVVLKELEKTLFFQVEGVQHLDKDQVVKELETPTHQILEEQVQQPEYDQVAEEVEKASHEIHQQQQQLIIKKLEHLKIPLADVQLATDGFSKAYEIPDGGGCTMYRAKLDDHFGKENHSSVVEGTDHVLIKRYPPPGHEYWGEKEFFTEVEVLSAVKHPNIVTLLGFCFEASEMILVLENASNGFLGDYLEDVNSSMRIFTWEKRLKICIDVAHALKYIHYEMEDQTMIINRDICSYNVFLDKNCGAKIVNFWWSVFLPSNQQDEALHISWIGRMRHIDPEYKKTNKLKRESDVYGLGVVLFEILCGRIAFDPIYLKENEAGLAHVAKQCYCSGTIQDIIDHTIKEETSENNFVLNRGPKAYIY
ncbi:uncharacterized protein LOC143609084 [Bidens hawaiensis]|uniref:uncharacterized protein LOC143609081 n=1 Tax=Bidens hawaiensis TaxID=980011 RepID=UPI00404A8292